MAWYDSWYTLMASATGNKPLLSSWITFFGALRSLALQDLAITTSTASNASLTKPGLMPVRDGDATHFYSSDGTQKVVSITDTFTIRLPAQEIAQNVLTPLSMGGDGAEVIKERLTNGFERWFLGFGYTDAQYACIAIPLPDDFNAGSLTIKALWETESSDLNTCAIDVYGELIDNNDLSAVSLSSAIANISDTNNGAGRLNISSAATLNPSGSGYYLILRFTRNYATDTLDDDVKILEFVIEGTRTVTT